MVGTDGTANKCSNNGGDGSASGLRLRRRALPRRRREVHVRQGPARRSVDPGRDRSERTTCAPTPSASAESGHRRTTSILGSTAKFGGGKAYVATDSITLNEAFQDITRDVVDTNVSFSAPTVAVNAFNRTQNLERPVHDGVCAVGSVPLGRQLQEVPPACERHDQGLEHTGEGCGERDHWLLRDRHAQLLVDGWTTVRTSSSAARPIACPSGKPQALYRPVDRRTQGDRQLGTKPPIAGSRARWSACRPPRPTRSAAQINWIRGADADDGDKDDDFDEARFEMGDPLHARPVSIIYRGTVAAPVGR